MKKLIFYFTFFLLIYLTLPLLVTAQIVNIPDDNLRAKIEDALGKASGATITAAEMAKLTHLEARNANIGDLTGLKHATNLTKLNLYGERVEGRLINSNSVSDISPVAGLTNLTSLDLGYNSISDISQVAGLTNLTYLGLWGNNISDISPVAGLTNLTRLLLENNNISDISPVADLTQLDLLYLGGNSITDISPVAGLTKLTNLSLSGNNISDISPVAGLTNLTSLTLGHNSISDISPLVENTGLGSGDKVYVRRNPLNSTSIKTHIPALKNRGITVEFDDTTNLNVDEPYTVELDNTKNLNVGEPYTVRLVYFLPSDRSPQRDIDTKLDTLIRNAQQFYADEMGRHGFGRKTFTFEADANGKVVVHHVNGQFADSYYRQNTFHKVWEEIREQFYTPHNIYFIAIDIGNERVGRRYNEVCSVGDSHGASGGHVLIPASGDCFDLRTAAHELGHAFGLHHDFRSDTYIMSFGRDPNKLSECAAEWLEAHRYFNTGQNQLHFDNPTKIQMLPPLASPPYAIGFRFEVTNLNGIHQAQLLTPATIRKQDRGQPKLLSCKRLNGETDTIVIELITNQLTVDSREVTLSVIDVHGNITSQTYPIDITTIFPAETVSTPDKNRVINIPEPVLPPFTIREAFELESFFQQWTDVKGFPVVASEMVNPYALKEAAWLIWQMIGHRPDVLQALVQNRAYFTVIGYTELLSQVPDSDPAPDFLIHSRASGGSNLPGHPQASTGEESLLHYPGYSGDIDAYSVLIHEFAHTIHLFGLNTVDPTFDSRLKIAYDEAMEKGLWQGTYASTNRKEYWADNTQVWFNSEDTPDDSSFNRIPSKRTELKNYDPDLAALLAEIYGDSEWRYTPPRERTHLLHLQGFDPQDSPTFQEWPELEELYRQSRNPNSDGGGRWVDLRPYDPTLLPSLIESRTFGPRTYVVFVNLTQANISVYQDGSEEFWTRIPASNSAPWHHWWYPCRTNDIWLVKDSNDKDLAVFQAVEKTGRILINKAPNLITPGLSKVSGDNQSGVPGTDLGNPLVIEVRDENGLPLGGISVTFTITAGGGMLSVTSTMTDENGAAQSTLTLGQNPGTNAVSVSAAGIESTVPFNAVAREGVFSPDSKLRTVIGIALNKPFGEPIVPSDMEMLMSLKAESAGISDLTGLEFATNLTELSLGDNSIWDISVVAELTQLAELALWSNNISDISAVAGLTNLTELSLGDNSIWDISVVAELTQLAELALWSNNISDISAMTGLTNLTWLDLGGNSILDISPVIGLTNLIGLDLRSNLISEISAMMGLTQLAELRLQGNTISDISAVVGLTNLTRLRLGNNLISDLSPLVANTGLGDGDWIDVRENPLSYASIHVHISTLQSRGVTVEFDNQAHPALLKISGDNQKGAALTSLSQPFVVEAQDENGSPLIGIPVTFAITAGGGTLNTTITRTDRNGRAQSTLTLGPNLGTNTVQVFAFGIEVPATFHAVSDTEAPSIAADVNNDGSVNVLDLVVVASELGNAGTNLAVDINRDGAVNVLDLILVAGMFDAAAAAPSAQHAPETLTAVEVQGWLTDARSLEGRDLIMQRGILVLEQLLVSLTPTETVLLPNYPNPFNPETWIPYHLAEPADVTLTIYDTKGGIVRRFDLGHQWAGYYTERTRAGYWDGRNNLGEAVASGVYFYHLSAGEYSQTRKMLILN